MNIKIEMIPLLPSTISAFLIPGLQGAYRHDRNRYIKITKVAIELSKTIAPKITATGTPKISL